MMLLLIIAITAILAIPAYKSLRALHGNYPHMRHLLFLAILAIPTASAYAWDTPPAQSPAPWAKATANPTITANPTSTATAGATARLRASQSQTVVVQQQQAQTPSTTLQGPGNGTSAAGWAGWNGSPVATANAPSFQTYNPCSGQAASMAAQTPLFGLSAGGTTMDTACQVMQTHVPWAAEWAAATLCRGDRDVRRAAVDIGHPCPQDWPHDQPQPVATVTSPPPMPSYCYDMGTWSRAEVARHPECGH